jgi:type II secretory pathway pseudopilin PulG
VNKLRYNETGDTLLEIILALVVMGIVVGAFLATYSTQGTGSSAHRSLVTADGVLRGYAEATKSAVRKQCTTAGASFSVAYTPSVPGFTVNSLGSQPCPPTTTPSTNYAANQPWAPIVLTVTLPSGQTRSLSLVVRSP